MRISFHIKVLDVLKSAQYFPSDNNTLSIENTLKELSTKALADWEQYNFDLKNKCLYFSYIDFGLMESYLEFTLQPHPFKKDVLVVKPYQINLFN